MPLPAASLDLGLQLTPSKGGVRPPSVGGPDMPLPLVSPCPKTNLLAARFASTKTSRSIKAASSTHPHLRLLCNQSTRQDHSPAGSRAHTSPERPCGTNWGIHTPTIRSPPIYISPYFNWSNLTVDCNQ